MAALALQAEMTQRLLGAPPIAVQISFVNLKMQARLFLRYWRCLLLSCRLIRCFCTVFFLISTAHINGPICEAHHRGADFVCESQDAGTPRASYSTRLRNSVSPNRLRQGEASCLYQAASARGPPTLTERPNRPISDLFGGGESR